MYTEPAINYSRPQRHITTTCRRHGRRENPSKEVAPVKNKVYDTFDQVVADIPDGSTIMFPGFGGSVRPRT